MPVVPVPPDPPSTSTVGESDHGAPAYHASACMPTRRLGTVVGRRALPPYRWRLAFSADVLRRRPCWWRQMTWRRRRRQRRRQ